MRIRIKHVTRYRYPEPAAFGPHIVRLRPADHTRARVLSYNLEISPKAALRWQQDPWGNRVVRATFDDDVRSETLSFEVDAAFEIRPVNPFDFFVDERCQELPFAYPDGLAGELAPFLDKPILTPKLEAFAAAYPAKGYIMDYLVGLNRDVANEVRYLIRNEPGIQTAEETLTAASGSCRDSAALLVDVLRANGLAARFVSGYLVQLTDEGNLPDEAKGVDHDVLDLHAWAEVYVPGAGWIGLDGTSGLLAGEGHIPLAGTVQPFTAGPVEGTASHLAVDLEVEMKVERLGHEPRPLVPYTEAQWAALKSAGRDVDAALSQAGLHVTMGGEPTWTSRLHPRAKEWNEGALGPTKWAQGIQLAHELLPRLAPGGLLLHRMGKHYPGESLPRWVMHLLWRKDGQPLWRDWAHLDTRAGGHAADDDGRTPPGGHGVEDARRFAEALARRLGVAQDDLLDAFEDPWVALTDEANLPDDVDPLQADLRDPEERRRLARILTRGIGTPVGQALPILRSGGAWRSTRWTFRRGHLFLVPGDSPMGLRLPLDRVGGEPPAVWPQDPSQRFGPLPAPPWLMMQRPGQALPGYEHPAGVNSRTALCVQARGGVLNVFLPPLTTTEDFMDLVAAVEDVAAESQVAVSLEGYPPPADPRINACLVTPDPGVIEVNLPVSERFDDYVGLMETISEAALHAGLTTERYQLDGRQVGSGGGHHLTLGGPSTPESPWLSQPRLLSGLIRYLQHHPSLSYLFASQFVGPTSQAPRVDEARHDALYELEIALAEVERHGAAPTPPWLVDRLFRNLLADVSGNTHRTEVSIDKLYDPNLPSGRQGLVEFRAFEMPPHPRMAVAQMLLVRGVVAMLTRREDTSPLVRWGSQLHDKFMLPHFLWADFEDVIRDLVQAGLPFDPEHYRPFLEFKCPVAGRYEVDDLHIELRTALEPWHVMGEEGSSFGTVRYVDSSVERVQVRVSGLTEGRHAVTVNGHRLPLRATGRASEAVAGVRFRAWQPPHCLHPNIGIHHPLRFDLVDTWGKRALGAATYHVWHPEGRAFDEPPLTAFEAGARRAQRFTFDGHAPYPVVPEPAPSHPEQPFTLDLRRFDPGA
ncbi:MAG: transglutaminase family protein [Deltaproteobacteria bacterium]|nr:transglutaminase family protein [Deltaproteobacteria bacterium]